MNTNTANIPLADLIQIGEILYASGLFGGLQNKEQGIARILRGQELGIPPVAAMTDERTLLSITPRATAKKTNAQHISDLLNELGITDPKQRKTIATEHLGGRKAADLTPEELEKVLSAIRQAYDEEKEEAEDVEAVETVVVEGNTAPVATPEPATTPETIEATVAADAASDEDEPTDARAAISATLDGAGITDVDQRQSIVKKQLLAVRRRKVESLTPEELATVIEGIAAAA
jgi:hypothetical protein